MNPIESMLAEPFGQALGWALVHFIWQGALVALALALALYLLRTRTAQARYAVACGALALLLALPVVTLSLLLPASSAAPEGLQVVAGGALDAAPDAPAQATFDAAPEQAVTPWQQRASAMLATALPWLVGLWMAGVLTLSLRYLAGWTYTFRLRRRGIRTVGQRWHDQLARMTKMLGVQRAVRLMASALVQVPTVVGWLRPVILMPVSVFAGLAPRQVEMIIAHELAHIRRHDYLVSLLQAMAETVLFYHPAVWWVSGRIRIEREHCCDDLVVAACGDAFTYAATLAQLEQVRQQTPRLALAATGGSLLDRIRRLLGQPTAASPRTARWLTGLAVLAVFVLSLSLSSTFNGFVEKTYDHVSGAALSPDQNSTSAQRRTLPSVGYTQTAVRLRQLIFARERQSVQLDALDELRALPKEASFPSLIQIAERHPNARVRNEAVQWLGRLGDAFVVFSLERIAFEDRHAEVQMEALDALRNLPESLGIPSLIKIARTHPRAAMRSEAVQWLGRLGDEAARTTLEDVLYEDADLAVQAQAFDALGNLPRGFSKAMLHELSKKHPHEGVRHEAAARLAQVQLNTQHRAQELLLQGIEQAQGLMNSQDASPTTYDQTARRVEALVFEDGNPDEQVEALEALAQLPGTAALAPLERIAETHQSRRIRRLAAQRLTYVRQQVVAAQTSQQALSQALDDLKQGSVPRRIAAVKQIEDMKERNVTGILTHVAFGDQSLEVQLQALDALRDRGGGLETMAAIARIIRTHPSAAMRQEAVQSIRRMAVHDQLDVLEKVVAQDTDPRVQQEALDALADLPDRAGFAVLTNMARTHPSPRIRGAAQQALGARDGKGKAFSDRMLAALRASQHHPDARQRAEAVRTLREWSSVNVITILADIAYDDPSQVVQMEALDALRDRSDWDGMSWVIHIARNHPDEALRVEAVSSLEEVDTITLLPVLEEVIFRDQSLAVQQEALDRLIDLPDDLGRPILQRVARRYRLPEALRNAAQEALDER